MRSFLKLCYQCDVYSEPRVACRRLHSSGAMGLYVCSVCWLGCMNKYGHIISEFGDSWIFSHPVFVLYLVLKRFREFTYLLPTEIHDLYLKNLTNGKTDNPLQYLCFLFLFNIF